MIASLGGSCFCSANECIVVTEHIFDFPLLLLRRTNEGHSLLFSPKPRLRFCEEFAFKLSCGSQVCPPCAFTRFFCCAGSAATSVNSELMNSGRRQILVYRFRACATKYTWLRYSTNKVVFFCSLFLSFCWFADRSTSACLRLSAFGVAVGCWGNVNDGVVVARGKTKTKASAGSLEQRFLWRSMASTQPTSASLLHSPVENVVLATNDVEVTPMPMRRL